MALRLPAYMSLHNGSSCDNALDIIEHSKVKS